MKHIEDYCVLINNIRMQGGTYTYNALAKVLRVYRIAITCLW